VQYPQTDRKKEAFDTIPPPARQQHSVYQAGLGNDGFSLIPGPLRGPFWWVCDVFFGHSPKNTSHTHFCERRRREECG